MFPVLLTAVEVAERWGCSHMTVRRAGLPFYRIGFQVRYSLTDVEGFELREFGYVVG